MDASQVLREARKAAGLTQRKLAELLDMPQPAIARYESGRVAPIVDTLDRLLRACGLMLVAVPMGDDRVDRELIRRLLTFTPEQRLDRMMREVNYLYDTMRRTPRKRRTKKRKKAVKA